MTDQRSDSATACGSVRAARQALAYVDGELTALQGQLRDLRRQRDGRIALLVVAIEELQLEHRKWALALEIIES